jgi:branched-chain amino acid transport system substrate-binding protein
MASHVRGLACGIVLALGMLLGRPALAADETIKIAFIGPFSGAFAPQGDAFFKELQYSLDAVNAKGGALGKKFELVSFDDKMQPSEAVIALKTVTDRNIPIVLQCIGSNVAAAMIDGVAKHNARNAANRVLYLNCAALANELTNEKCDFWHFRLDADTTMKMEALTAFMKDQPKVKKVYIIGQNYSHGQQVAKYFKEDIARKRPDVKIVGEDLHPIGQVKDFSPYVAKIKQSGADTIVTGNWGQDLTLLVKALNDAGLKIPMYTYYAGVTGTPTALAAGGDSEVYVVAYGHANHGGELGQIGADFKKKFNDDYYTFATYNGIQLLGAAMAKAKSMDPVAVAKALENLQIKSFAGDVTMRASDHQLQQTMYITKWQKADKKYPYSVENTGYTFVPIKQMDPYVSSTPTSCQMKRPGGAS